MAAGSKVSYTDLEKQVKSLKTESQKLLEEAVIEGDLSQIKKIMELGLTINPQKSIEQAFKLDRPLIISYFSKQSNDTKIKVAEVAASFGRRDIVINMLPEIESLTKFDIVRILRNSISGSSELFFELLPNYFISSDNNAEKAKVRVFMERASELGNFDIVQFLFEMIADNDTKGRNVSCLQKCFDFSVDQNNVDVTKFFFDRLFERRVMDKGRALKYIEYLIRHSVGSQISEQQIIEVINVMINNGIILGSDLFEFITPSIKNNLPQVTLNLLSFQEHIDEKKLEDFAVQAFNDRSYECFVLFLNTNNENICLPQYSLGSEFGEPSDKNAYERAERFYKLISSSIDYYQNPSSPDSKFMDIILSYWPIDMLSINF